ncbi:hypothetical protein EI94DRAFT_1821361 [Lactarius quietus]|nr:hypothetical protein EI94DRAFT_1821361 [Lactarius quietus]
MSSPSPLPSHSVPPPIHSQLLPDFVLIPSTKPLPPLDPTSLSSPPCFIPPSASPSPLHDSLPIPLLSHSPESPLLSFGAISLPHSSSLPSDWPPTPSPSPPALAPYDFPPPLTFPLSPPPQPPDAVPASSAKPHATSPPSSPSPSSSRASPFQLLDSTIMSLRDFPPPLVFPLSPLPRPPDSMPASPVESQPPPPSTPSPPPWLPFHISSSLLLSTLSLISSCQFLDSTFLSPHGFPPPVVTPLSTPPQPPNVMPPNVADTHPHLPPHLTLPSSPILLLLPLP